MFATLPFWIERVGLYQYLGVEILIWATYALAFNLVLGHSGLPSFGHGAFFGLGAYAFGLAQFNLAAICGSAWPSPCSRQRRRRHRRALHLASARHLLRADDHRLRPGLLVHRHQGARSPAARTGCSRSRGCRPTARRDGHRSQDNVALYYFALAIFVVVSLLLWRLVHSPFGRVLKAIKQNETRARFVGYHVWRYKAAVLVVSAGLSGLAGAFAMAQASAFPDVMSLHYSAMC